MLPQFDDFCERTELDIARPITQQMLTKQIVDAENDQVLVRVQERYVLKYLRGRVKSVTDLRENVAVRLTRLDPGDMKHWSEQPCLLDESAALEIAKHVFQRLGFDERNFDPTEAHRYRWQPSPADPDNVLWLPVFMVKWYQKGYSRDQAVPPHVEMDISGTTKKLVYFLDATEKNRRLFLSTPLPSNLIPTNAVAVPLSNKSASHCEGFAKAAGINLADTWRRETKVVISDPPVESVCVGESYVFEVRNNLIERFRDHEKWLRQFPEDFFGEVEQWVGKPPLIVETQAMNMAMKIFQRLGFDPQRFYPTSLESVELQVEDPKRPGVVLALPPSYRVRWVGKQPFWARNGSPEIVWMEISTTTTNLIYYQQIPSTFRF